MRYQHNSLLGLLEWCTSKIFSSPFSGVLLLIRLFMRRWFICKISNPTIVIWNFDYFDVLILVQTDLMMHSYFLPTCMKRQIWHQGLLWWHFASQSSNPPPSCINSSHCSTVLFLTGWFTRLNWSAQVCVVLVYNTPHHMDTIGIQALQQDYLGIPYMLAWGQTESTYK